MKRLSIAVVVLALAACSTNEPKAVEAGAAKVGTQRSALVQSFAAGSLIIPMDTTSQDNGTLLAFGLIDRLLRVSTPVHRILKDPKTHQEVDMTVAVTNRRGGASLGTLNYSSSPFVVAAADATPAVLTIVDNYLTTHAGVNVHVASAAFSADVARTLVASPRIAALKTGNQSIIYGYLNAANITDANGNTWSDASPGAISLAQLAGTNTGGALDSALMSGGLPAYDQFTVVHYQPTGGDPSRDELTRELRGWLVSRPTNHAHLQCSSTLVFENNATHGRFLSNLGIADVGGNSDPVEVLQPTSLYAQYSGTLQIDPGDTKSFTLNTGSTLWDNSSLLVQLAASTFGTRMNWLTGYVDGNTNQGKISYLGGHSYSTALPISANPRTNGVRLFLNGLFETPALFGSMQPTLTLAKSAPTFTNSTSVTFSIAYSNTGPGVAYAASISDTLPVGTTFVSASAGGVNTAGTVKWTLGDLPPGASGTVSVTLTAPQGTYQNQAVLAYRVGITPKTFSSNVTTTVVDTTRPVTTITAQPANPTNSTAATFSFSATETATFQCRLDAGAFVACTSPVSYTGLAEGSHTFTVRATDTAGNTELSPPSYTWSVDLTAPSITFTSTPPANSNSTSASLAFSVTGATTVECQLNSGAFAPCTSPVSYTGLAEGDYTFTVRATDAAGNVSTTSYDWKVDTTAPALAFTSTPGNPTNQTTATFGFSVSGATIVECQHAPGAYAACTSPTTLTGVSDGTHTFNVRASDAAGNTATISYTWVINTVAPTVTILSGPSNPTTATAATLTFSVSSTLPLASTQCRLNGGAFAACASPFFIAGPLADGSYTFTVRATDTSANVGSANYIWVVDTTAPVVTFNGTPANPSNVATGDIGFAVNEPATTECSFNGGAFAACTSPYDFGTLTDGAYSLAVRATDPAGNSTTETFSWTVDLTVPALAFTSTPSSPTNATTASLAFTVSGANTVQCQLDSGAFAACTSPFATGTLAEGSHTVTVRASDTAGNVATISHTWTVDTTAPALAFTSTPATPTSLTSAAFAFTVTGATTVECQLDSGAFSACTSPVNLAGLADGSHTFTVRASDAANNTITVTHTWTVDTVAPDVTFTSIPTDPSNSASATLAFAVTGGATSIQCQLDSGAFATCTSPTSLTGLAEGSHTFTVRAADAAGNTRSTSHTWVVDTVAPNTTFDSTPAAATSATSGTFAFSSTEGGTFECSLDGAAFAACLSPATLTGLAEGSHTYRARAIDSAGNVDPTPASFTWTVDTTAPTTTLDSTPASASNSTSASFSFSSNEGAATFECSLDGAAFTACTSPQALTGLSEGSHTFAVRAVDAAGNTDATPASFTWTVDVTPPDTTLTSGPTGTVNSTSASFTFTSGEAGTFQCSLDGAAFATCTTPRSLSGLTEGSHTFSVRAVDAAGNVDATPASRTWTVDLTAPNTTLTSTPPASSNDATGDFTFTSSEPGSTFECRLDSGAFTACTSPFATAPLAEGSHTFAVRATDPSGNTDATPASYTWTVDVTAPNTTLTSTPPAASNDGTPDFTFASSEPGSTFECSLDGAAFTACASPFTTTTLAEGSHTFQVRATDSAGNTDATPASYTWTVDQTPPETTLTAGPTGTVNVTTASLTFTASEASSTFECRLDGGAFTACTSPRALSGLAEGSHTFEVRAIDPAGNVDPTPASRTWVIDVTEPDTTITGGPIGLVATSAATFTFTSPEFGVTFECSLDSGAFSACPTPHALTALAEGNHTLLVRAVDVAGNRDQTPASRTWTVDTIAPDTSIVAGPTGAVSSASATFGLSSSDATATFECDLDGAGFSACGAAPTFSGLAEGSHTLLVRAVDPAGNVDPTPASRTWTVDTLDPETTIVTGPSGPTPSATATFEVSSNEGTATFECSLDGAAFAACASPVTLPGLAEGAHTFAVRAVDAAGNRDQSPATRSWTVDTIAPDTTLLTAPSGLINVSTASFTFSSNEAGVVYECSFDSAAFASCTSPVNLTSIFDGNHTFRVRARDAAGNVDATPATATWQVDAAEPDTLLTGGPTGTVAQTSATFDFQSTKANSTFQCSLDNGAFTSCTTPATFSGLADGSHTLQVRAVDPATNVDSTPASRTWTVDTVAPETTVVTRPATVTNSASATLDFSSNETAATFECSLDGATFAACSDPATFASLADGLHVLLVRAVDAAGNRDATPSLVTWTVDTVAPEAPRVLEPVAGSTTSAFPTFGGTAEPGSTVTVTSGGTTVCTAVVAANGTWSCPTGTAFGSGPQTVTATATDPAGNTSPASPPLTFTVDPTTPETIIRTGPSGLVASTSAAFTVASDRSGVTFECSLDGSTFATCTDAPSFTNLSQGAHHFEVRAVNGGTRDPSPAVRDWVVDTVAPAAPVLTSPAANATTSATPVFAGTAEAGSTVVVSVDGTQACTAVADAQGAFSCSAPTAFPAGSHTVNATATDLVGNTSTPSANVTFTVDASTLDTAIIAGPSGTVRSSSAAFAFAATVLGATFECSLDGAAFAACPTPTTLSNLAQGSHTLEVRAVSGSTTDTTPASRTWTVDSVAPTAPVVLAPANNSTVYSRTPRYSGTAEPNSTVRVSVDDRRACTTTADAFGAWSCSSTTELASGPHRVAAVATDGAGNTSPSSAINVFTVDIPTVSVAITSPADGTLTGDNTPTIGGTSYPGATVTVFVDGANVGTTVADGMGNWSFTPSMPLADGARVVTAQAAFMGHQSPTSNSITVRVDTTPPVVTLTVDQAAPERMPTVSFTSNESPVTWECSLDGAAFTACESPLDVSAAGEGSHRITVRATDEAGNTGSAERSYTVVNPMNPGGDLPGALALRGGGCGCGATDGAGGVLALLAMLMLGSRRGGRRLRRLTAGAAVLGAVLTAGVASAQTQAVSGFDLERLDLNPGAAASLITHTGDLMKKGSYRVSLTGHYQHDSLLLFRTQTNERLGAIVGSRVTAHLAGAWAPLDWLEVGLQVPVVLWQGGDDLSAYNVGAPTATALGTPWLTGRFGLLREAGGAPLDVSLQLGLGLPLGSAAAYSNALPLAFAPRVGLGKKVTSWLRLGGDLGVVVRGTPAVPGAQTVSQADTGPNFLYGVSATTLGDGLRGELTLRGGVGLEQGQGAAELLIGARYPFAKQFEVYAIGGPGFGTLPGNPAFRVLAGLAWQPPVDDAPKKAVCTDATPAELLATMCPELDRDGDGVKNAIDECPLVLGVEGRRGCPVPDTDEDGLTDDVDVCPKEAGLKERRGCPVRDLDNDGLEDDKDECPAEAGPVERKGCPVHDKDQDGVEDDADQCPTEAGPADRKGCPFKDQDADTVEDAVDNCPTEKGDPANAGCPKKMKQLVIITADKLVIKEKVFFATGKAAVLAKSFALLDNVAKVLLAHPEVQLVRIEGHTDSVGNHDANVKLSQDRAESVKTYLVKQKVAPERLKAVGFGPDQPTAPNDTPAGREQNRRVEFNFEAPAKSTTQEVPATP